MAIEWEVGDEFIIIDPEKDRLQRKFGGKIFTVSHTEFLDYSIMNRCEVPCIWFRLPHNRIHFYATLDNIRKPTPLEKII